MMDKKYLAEIKTRDNAELPKTAAPVFRDRHALLAEVERLGKETATLKRALECACADRATTPSMWQDLQKKYMEIAHQAQKQEGKK